MGEQVVLDDALDLALLRRGEFRARGQGEGKAGQRAREESGGEF